MSKRQTAKVTFRKGWERDLYRLPGTKEALELPLKRVEAYAKGDAPRRNARGLTSWTSIRRNIISVIAMDSNGWYAGVVTEANDRVRHAMLVEKGFNHISGRRIPARRWLKGALLKARKE